MERIETKKIKIGKTIVKGKPVILYGTEHEWRFTPYETKWIKKEVEKTLPDVNKRRKDVASFIQDLQRCCSDKKFSLEKAKNPDLKPLNKRDLERVIYICEEAQRCLWAIQGADYLLIDTDQEFVAESKEKARITMKSLSPFILLLAEKLLKKKRGRNKSPHINFIREIIEIYKKHIKGKPTQKELKEIVSFSLDFLELPYLDPSRGLKQAMTKLS